MVKHSDMGKRELFKALKVGKIRLGGNLQLKIYGTLHCRSGKRLLKNNRVFFANEQEAVAEGYRPCSHCMRTAYKKWKDGII